MHRPTCPHCKSGFLILALDDKGIVPVCSGCEQVCEWGEIVDGLIEDGHYDKLTVDLVLEAYLEAKNANR
jgi:hypothetical protein